MGVGLVVRRIMMRMMVGLLVVGRMIDFKLFGVLLNGRTDRRTDERTDICTS